MAAEPGQQRQRVDYVVDVDVFRAWIERVELTP